MPEDIEAGERNSPISLRVGARRSVPSAADQQDGPYVHDCHLGAAARKIADREGTHDGILPEPRDRFKSAGALVQDQRSADIAG